MKLIALLLTITPTYLCLHLNINNLFENINQKVLHINAKGAEIVWESTVNPDSLDLLEKADQYQEEVIKWETETCENLATLYRRDLLNSSQAAQTYFLCRGPKNTLNETRLLSNLYYYLLKIYAEAEICIPSSENIEIDNIQQVEIAILEYITKIDNMKYEHDEDSKIDDFLSKDAITNEDKEKGFCLKGEEDFEKLMELSKNEAVLRLIWLAWREKVGPPMKEPYRFMVEVANVGARTRYGNIGKYWRDELEIPHLRQLCRQLYNRIRPLYTVLHGVVRFYLRRFYGEVVPERGPIPAHLLGNLWSQNWEPLIDLITPKTIDLNQNIKKLNWTAIDMARKAEDFYRSFGLPAMTEKFWQESIFARGNKNTRCHGSAADMFKDGDFRMVYCSGSTMEDFYVFVHEMGHIQYFMAYEKQPALFRGANAALHESIGDAVMNGVMTPQHLYRLGLINESLLYVFDENDDTNENNGKINADNDDTKANYDEINADDDDKNLAKKYGDVTKEIYLGYFKRERRRVSEDIDGERYQIKDVTRNQENVNMENDKLNIEIGKVNFIESFDELLNTDEILMLKQALNKLPQIPFALLIDEYRWKYFEGGISKQQQNKVFWEMATELQGIAPSNDRGEEYFDIGAKFHVPDNTPYIRYFLSSFLQHQLFEALCKAAVYGRKTSDELPESLTLNRCDIYGSKAAGKILKDLMSQGHSQHWLEIFKQATGENGISASSLMRYYRPLYEKLLKFVQKHRIPIGWKEVNKNGYYFA